MGKKKVVKRKSSKLPAAIISGIAVIVLAAIFIFNGLGKSGKDNQSVNNGGQTKQSAASGTDLIIPKSEVTEVVKFYPYKVGNVNMEVLAVKAKDGTIRTSLNTCQVCYSSGRGYYVQKGDTIVCQNCGNVFNISQIERIKGGCNPVPITGGDKKDDGTNIVISKTFMTESKDFFLNWKK